MASIYDTLLNRNFSPDRMQMTADRLRRQEAFGTLGVMTGDPVLSQFGAQQLKRTGEQTESLRRAMDANNRILPLGEGRYAQGGEVRMLPGYQEEQQAKRQHQLDLAMAKAREARMAAEAKAERKANVIPESTWKNVAKGISQVDLLGSLIPQVEASEGISQPIKDVVANTAGELGLGGAARIVEPSYRNPQARALRSQIAKVITDIRNSAFGAALTKYEGENFEKVNPLAPGLTKADMVQRLRDMVNALTKEAKTMIAGRRTPGNDPVPAWVEEGWDWETPDSSGTAVNTPEGSVVAEGATEAPAPAQPQAGSFLKTATTIIHPTTGKKVTVYPDGRMVEED